MKKGFTLIELIAVIAILTVIFVFATPRLVKLINNNGQTEIEIIEKRVLNAAKEYANNYDSSFYRAFIKEGDKNYVYKSDILSTGLVDEIELSKLDNFIAVEGELLGSDKIKYTVKYINNSNNTYTQDELYLMIQSLKNRIDSMDSLSGVVTSSLSQMSEQLNENTGNISSINTSVNNNTTQITNIKSNMSNLTDKNNSDNVFLKIYPVGSIYISTTNTNPGTIFGGTWAQIKDRFLLASGDSYTAGSTGGASSVKLYRKNMPKNFNSIADIYGQLPNAGDDGIYRPTDISTYSLTTSKVSDIGSTYNRGWKLFAGNELYPAYVSGNGEAVNTMPPYLSVYMWKRTA